MLCWFLLSAFRSSHNYTHIPSLWSFFPPKWVDGAPIHSSTSSQSARLKMPTFMLIKLPWNWKRVVSSILGETWEEDEGVCATEEASGRIAAGPLKASRCDTEQLFFGSPWVPVNVSSKLRGTHFLRNFLCFKIHITGEKVGTHSQAQTLEL